MFATGLEAGDYFICNRGSKQNNYEPTELAIFKIGENYALEEADLSLIHIYLNVTRLPIPPWPHILRLFPGVPGRFLRPVSYTHLDVYKRQK